MRPLSLFLLLAVLFVPRLALAQDAGKNAAKIALSASPTIADAGPVRDAAAEQTDAETEAPADTASAAPAASEIPSAAPSTSASAATTEEGKEANPPAEVKIHDSVVFLVRAPLGPTSIDARAKVANKALEGIHFEHGQPAPETRVEAHGDTSVVYVGDSPIFTVGPDDAKASGDPSVAVAAEKIAGSLRDVLRTEQKRAAIAESVYSFSLLVFSGVLAFWLLRQTNALLGRVRNHFREHPGFLQGLRLGQIEVLSRASTRGAVSVALSLAHRLLQLTIAYIWLVIALSLFDATRAYTGRLTGFVFQPLSALLERLGSALPVVVVAGFAAVAVGILVRFIGLFFESVARGETKLEWIPPDLAPATSILLRGGIIVAALALGSPLVTGSDDGPLPRVGLVTILVLGVSAVPLLSSAVVGAVVLFARAVRVGDYVEWGGHVGRVKSASLLSLHLVDEAGCDLFVPHLLSLVNPTRVLGHAPLATIDVVIDPAVSQARAHAVLIEAVQAFRGRVALIRIDGAGAHYRLTASDPDENNSNLVRSLSETLERQGVGLARAAFSIRPSSGEKS